MEKVRNVYEKLLLEYPKKIADTQFYHTFGRYINWNEPKDLNEKINWLAFNTDTTKWSELSDKYNVHEYVKSKGLSEILNPIYKKWDNIDEINFENLPNSFVLKTNCGSGDIVIVKNKNEENLDGIKKYFKKVLSKRFGIETSEPHYLRIKPCVFAEKLLSNEIVDYKVWCFNGKPYCVFTVSNRDNKTHKRDINVFDLEWNKHKEWLNTWHHNDVAVKKPTNLQEMLKYATILSEGFPQVRVDFYEQDDKIYFGEMTFTSACGRMLSFSQEALITMGDLCIIN